MHPQENRSHTSRIPGGVRGATVLALVAAAAMGAWGLDLSPRDLVPREAGWSILKDLAAAAVNPATHYETAVVEGTAPFWLKVLGAAGMTLLYGAAAMGLALPLGLGLGALSSEVLWGGAHAMVGGPIRWAVRITTSILRSVHELIWAVLFLAALGLSPATAVLAIAIPFTGTIAKVSSEIYDETSRSAAHALQAAGSGHGAALLVGLFPSALPNLASYGFYRFECALRSAAVLGFFGAPTIGLYVAQSFENLQLREMWTYLYVLVAMVIAMEWLGARLRRSLQ